MIDPNGASKRRARLHTRAVLLAATSAVTAYLLGGALSWWSAPDGVGWLGVVDSTMQPKAAAV